VPGGDKSNQIPSALSIARVSWAINADPLKKKSAKSVVICVICVKREGFGTGDNLPLKQSPLTNYLPLRI
jgi:hypothetical protein